MDISGSRSGQKINTAVDNIVKIYDEHVNDGDHVSFVPFESQVISDLSVALTLVDAGNRQGIRNKINTCRKAGGVTQLYHALNYSLDKIAKGGGKGQDFESWIICLTDGDSDGAPEEVLPNLINRQDAHLIIIGVALDLKKKMFQRCRHCVDVMKREERDSSLLRAARRCLSTTPFPLPRNSYP